MIMLERLEDLVARLSCDNLHNCMKTLRLADGLRHLLCMRILLFIFPGRFQLVVAVALMQIFYVVEVICDVVTLSMAHIVLGCTLGRTFGLVVFATRSAILVFVLAWDWLVKWGGLVATFLIKGFIMGLNPGHERLEAPDRALFSISRNSL